MPNLTPNYNLKKPLGTESALISVLNENFDTIDTALKPTVSDTTAPTSSSTSGLLATVLGWFANRIKAITGKSHWYDAPPTTLSAAANHMGYGGTSRHPNVTTTTSGFMSASDKIRLDNATSEANGGRIVMRDSSGRAKVANPSNTQDIANKSYVDTNINSTMAGHTNSDNAHPVATESVSGFMSADDKKLLDTATENYTPHSIVRRDGSGRLKVAYPNNSYDAAPKTYVDGKLNKSNYFTTGNYTGDGSNTRTISLGFTPSCVILMDMFGNTLDDVDGQYGGMAMNGLNCLRRGQSTTSSYLTSWNYRYCLFGITSGGFMVSGYNSKGSSNTDGRRYFYVAFR